ncbi:MAG TPA: hypothetical protein VMV19_07000 [Xanthobacteraceae bacterium]|nr:hypothetical protein [Xanthobacteraceae bacterium]
MKASMLFLMGLLAASCAATYARAAASNPFDGEWVEVIVGENQHCDVTVNTEFTVSGGHLSQPGSSGTVRPNGSAVGTSSNSGLTATWTGHFSRNKAAGRFRRSDGCVGRWSAVRH